MKTLLITLSFFISISVFSQNITSTLGTNGVFTIKDASINYLTLNQSNGQLRVFNTLRLENTTNSTLGVLFKETNRFLHNYGISNTFLGINSGNFTMTGTGNIGVGSYSLSANSTGYSNTAVGISSLRSNTTGFGNTGVGSGSLFANSTGYDNTALGRSSLQSNTTGYHNTALGYSSLSSNTTGDFNTAVGYSSLQSNTTGDDNTALGHSSLSSNTTGFYNTAVGRNSLLYNTTGDHNTALGYISLLYNTTGNSNTALGDLSLFNNTTGNSNTALGYYAGSAITTGSNLTCLGKDAEPSTGISNNQITLGNSSVTSLRCNVQTISSLSDVRDKNNIKDLTLGLDFLMKIKPRLFNWDKREWYEDNTSDGSKMSEAPTAGFIAQELDEVQTTENAEWLNLVLKDNPEKLEATSGNLLPVMVKAIQELKVESEKLKVENEKLKVASLTVTQENIKLKNENEKLFSDVKFLKSMNEKIVKLEKIVSELSIVKQSTFNSGVENKTISKEGDVR